MSSRFSKFLHSSPSRESSPAPPKDDAATESKAQDAATEGKTNDGDARVSLSTEHEPIGQATAHHGAANATPILNTSTGAPVTYVPPARAIQATLDSGSPGLGPEGEAALRSNSYDSAIAPARGLAPEAVVSARNDSSPAKKLASKVDSDNKSLTQTALSALTAVAPSSILGVSFANLGGDNPAKEIEDTAGSSSPTGETPARKLTAPQENAVDSEALKAIEVADEKEQIKFHKRFPNAAEEDKLIDSWPCALQREILIHGRIFRAKLFSYETTVQLPLTEVVSLEKRNTALVIPNGLEICTRSSRHSFASIIKRDEVFERIVGVWKHSHPDYTIDSDNRSVKDLAAVENVADNKSAKSDSASVTSSETKKSRKKLRMPSISTVLKKDDDKQKKDNQDDEGGVDHEPTTCSCEDKHFDNVVLDTTFPVSPETLHKLFFDSAMLLKFWSETEQLTEVHHEDWSPSISDNDGSRTYDYIKPLNASMGPKSTKCLLEDANDYVDYDKAVSTLTTTRTPDVPSGKQFATRTRTCMTWCKQGTRVVVSTQVDWEKVNRFIKGIVDKSSTEGQRQYHNDLAKCIREHLKDNSDLVIAGGDANAGADDEAQQSGQSGFISSITSVMPSDPIQTAAIALLLVLVLTNLYTFYQLRRVRHDPFVSELRQTQRLMTELESRMTRLRSFAAALDRV